MNIVKPSFKIQGIVDGITLLKNIESYARICYMSSGSITEDSYKEFIQKILKSGHHTVLEHEKITVIIVCNRGVTHQLVRHRIASYSQESTHFCNYSNKRFNHSISFIHPGYKYTENTKVFDIWYDAMENAEKAYFKLLELGLAAADARDVLPVGVKSSIAVTMNLRAWRNFFIERCSPDNHRHMLDISLPMLEEFKRLVPYVYDNLDLLYKTNNK